MLNKESYVKEDERAYKKYRELLKAVTLEYIKDLAYLRNKYEFLKYVDEKFVNTSIELIKKYNISEEEVSKKLNLYSRSKEKPLEKQLERSRTK